MEPVSSPPQESPEKKNQVEEPSQNEAFQQWVKGFKSTVMDRDLGESFMNKIEETASSVQEFALQWEDYEKEMKLQEDSLKKQILELEKKEEVVEEREKILDEKETESDLKQNLMMMVLENVINETIQEKLSELEKKDEIFKLKHEVEAKEIEEKNKCLLLKEKKLEELKSELEAKKNEISLLDENIKAKSSELEKKVEIFQLKQEAEAKEIEEKTKMLVLKEKELEEREKEIVMKQRELEEEERSTQAETHKRSRLEFESPLLADNTDSLILPGKKHKPVRDLCIETDSALVLHQGTSSVPASSDQSSEVKEIDDLEPEPFNCPDPDFKEFSNTMSSFAVGQVWALYDPLDDMPRYYAQIKRIFKAQLTVRVNWLESDNENATPIACGRFKHQGSETQSLSMFSHKMHHITCGKHVIINPRKGETWALFRDWTKTWNNHKPPFRYDFVEVISEFDEDHGIGVAYLGKVERFKSVYKAAEQHGLIQAMISTDEMLKFSHRVPSFKLTGDEKEEVPVGSFQLDPAAIPRAYLVAAKVKEENTKP